MRLEPRYQRLSLTRLRIGLSSRWTLLVSSVSVEGPRWRKLTELVPNHIFRDEDRHEFAAIMNGERQPHCLGEDRGTTRPGLDDLLLALGLRVQNLLQQMSVDERTFLDTARHGVSSSSFGS